MAAPSKNKDAAYDFVKYLTDLPSATVMAVEGRQSPSNQAVYAVPAVANDPVLKAFRTQVEVAVPMPNLPEMTMVWSPATIMMASVAKGTIQPKAALDKAQAEVLKNIDELHKN